MSNREPSLILAGLGLLAIVGYFAGPVAWRLRTPDEVACDAAKSVSGWQSCEVSAHHIAFVSMRDGCGHNDGQAFRISGKNAGGSPASATVCCGTFWKGCTLRAP